MSYNFINIEPVTAVYVVVSDVNSIGYMYIIYSSSLHTDHLPSSNSVLLPLNFQVPVLQQRCRWLSSGMLRRWSWWWRHKAPLKSRSVFTRLHGTASQKSAICMPIVVKTWNITMLTHIPYFSYSKLRILTYFPLQNPILCVLVAEGVTSYDGEQSAEAKVWGIVPKDACHWGGDGSVVNDPFGAPGSIPSYVCLAPAWGFVGGDCSVPRFLWD
jgi:hypothetical protein